MNSTEWKEAVLKARTLDQSILSFYAIGSMNEDMRPMGNKSLVYKAAKEILEYAL